MAKFNSGNFGLIHYEARPIGFRKYFRFGKISPIPYLVGYDIWVDLAIKTDKKDAWYGQGILGLVPQNIVEGYPPNAFHIKKPNKKSKVSEVIHLYHPAIPMTFSCNFYLQNVRETNNILKPIVDKTQSVRLIEDIKVFSLHTVLGWSIGIIVGITTIITAVIAIILKLIS